MAEASSNAPAAPEAARHVLLQAYDAYIGIRQPIFMGLKFVFQSLSAHIRAGDWGILFRWGQARDEGFAEFYKAVGVNFAAYEATTVVPGLVASAHGVVLELGPGPGLQLERFDMATVSHIYGVESNTGFAEPLAAKVRQLGMEDKYTAVFCGIEDTDGLLKAGITPGSIDCIVSMQVMCSVKHGDEIARQLYRLLKPGGQIIFWEHCRSHNIITRIFQHLWNPIWQIAIGGCRLDNTTKENLLQAGEWEVVKIEEDKDSITILPRVWGRLIKPLAADSA